MAFITVTLIKMVHTISNTNKRNNKIKCTLTTATNMVTINNNKFIERNEILITF